MGQQGPDDGLLSRSALVKKKKKKLIAPVHLASHMSSERQQVLTKDTTILGTYDRVILIG